MRSTSLAGSRGLAKSWETNDLDEHLALIKRQVNRSLDDYETVQLARKIASGKADGRMDGKRYVEAWGEAFVLPDGSPCPQRDGACEMTALWNFWVANVRYVYDPPDYDLFCTAKLTLLAGSGDCFTHDTKIIVRSKASKQYEIKTLRALEHQWPAYEALSYDFAGARWVFKPITAWTDRGLREVVTSHLGNGVPFTHTPDHKVWWWDGQREYRKVVARELGDEVDPRDDHRRVLVARKIPALNKVDLSQPEAYLAGIYAAEGNFTGANPKLSIAQSRIANPEVVDRIDRALAAVGASYRYFDRGRSGSYFGIHAGEVRDWLATACTNSFDAAFPCEVLSGSEEVVRTVLEAHGDGDAYRPQPGSNWATRVSAIHATSSERMADQLQLAAMILGEAWHTQLQARHQGAGNAPIYRFHRFLPETRPARRWVPELDGVGYSSMTGAMPAGVQRVADITVEGTHNFVLSNGMIAHNCDDGTVGLVALHKAIGFEKCVARVVTVSGEQWEHIYPLIGLPKEGRGSVEYVPLDFTVPGAKPGYEFTGVSQYRDFYL